MKTQEEPWYGHKLKEYPGGVWRCECGAELGQGTTGGPCGDNSPMAQTNAQRQEALRAKREMLGLTEVRGIYMPPESHPEIKKIAKNLLYPRRTSIWWSHVSDRHPACEAERVFLGVNSSGFVGAFNSISVTANQVDCFYETAEENIEVMDCLEYWCEVERPSFRNPSGGEKND